MINLKDKYAMFENGTFDTIRDDCGILNDVFTDEWGNYYMSHFVVIERNKCTYTIRKCDKIIYTFNEVTKNERV